MAIERIDLKKCIGCRTCLKVCSCDVIRLDANGKPSIKYKDECCLCLYCQEDCPTGAIYVSPHKYVKQLQAWG